MEIMQLSLYQIIGLIITVSGALIGIYLKFNNLIILLEARVTNLEKDNIDFEIKLDEISKGVNQILLILAQNQIHSKS